MSSDIPPTAPSNSSSSSQSRWFSYRDYSSPWISNLTIFLTSVMLIIGIILLSVGSAESTRNCYNNNNGFYICYRSYPTTYVVGWVFESVGFFLLVFSCCFVFLTAAFFTPTRYSSPYLGSSQDPFLYSYGPPNYYYY
jgi:hypothetical protein